MLLNDYAKRHTVRANGVELKRYSAGEVILNFEQFEAKSVIAYIAVRSPEKCCEGIPGNL